MNPESPSAEQESACHYMPLAEDAEPLDLRPCLFCNACREQMELILLLHRKQPFSGSIGARDPEIVN